jgi:erythromycin esterase-like protein
VIVWTGSFHNARSLEEVTTLAGKPYGGTTVPDEPMARHLAKALGDRMYSLGFIAAEGEYFRRAPRGAAPIPPPEPGSLEDLCLRAKLENAWIDFAGAGADGTWLRQTLVAGPFQYQKRRADWTRVFDGLVFTRKMEAAVPLAAP